MHVKHTDQEEKALIEIGTEGQSLTEREREASEGGDTPRQKLCQKGRQTETSTDVGRDRET